jgi:tetratricopeptide (TPR) repeat protein
MLPRFIGFAAAVFVVAVFTCATSSFGANPTGMAAELQRIEAEWARITYQVTNSDDQDKQMRALAAEAAAVAARYPGRAEPLIWQGIVASSEAKYAGAFGALGFAKQARDFFEQAGRIDYRAVDGAVPTSLGALYYLVPGFPLGFGDNGKARQYLEQGVQISPNGLDSNFFYGDFLFSQGEYGKASIVLKHALSTPSDPQRPVWDAGRRAEIRALLAKVDKKIAAGG